MLAATSRSTRRAERKRLGIDCFVDGATGVDLLRRNFFEPTCNIAGIVAGFTVPGASKTVLPKEVMAKLDMRLVPNQTPRGHLDKLQAHLDKRGFDGHLDPTRSPGSSRCVRRSDSLIGRASDRRRRRGLRPSRRALQPMMIGTGPMYPIAAERSGSRRSPPPVSTARLEHPRAERELSRRRLPQDRSIHGRIREDVR